MSAKAIEKIVGMILTEKLYGNMPKGFHASYEGVISDFNDTVTLVPLQIPLTIDNGVEFLFDILFEDVNTEHPYLLVKLAETLYDELIGPSLLPRSVVAAQIFVKHVQDNTFKVKVVWGSKQINIMDLRGFKYLVKQ